MIGNDLKINVVFSRLKNHFGYFSIPKNLILVYVCSLVFTWCNKLSNCQELMTMLIKHPVISNHS